MIWPPVVNSATTMAGNAPKPEQAIVFDKNAQSPGSPNDFTRQLRGFGPVGILAILVILIGNTPYVPLSALLVLGWAWLSKT